MRNYQYSIQKITVSKATPALRQVFLLWYHREDYSRKRLP